MWSPAERTTGRDGVAVMVASESLTGFVEEGYNDTYRPRRVFIVGD